MSSEDNENYSTLAEAGHKTVMDLAGQANNLAVLSVYEEQALAAPQSHKWPASAFTLRALRTSATLMQFMTFEGIANFMAALAIAISSGKPSAPAAIRSLHPVEIDFLLERNTIFNPKNGQITTRAGVFSASLDRLTMVPRLLGAVVGEECGIDKGGEGWRLVRQLKELRDSLTHPRVIGPANAADQPTVESKDVFQGARALHWYLKQIEPLLVKIQVNPEGWVVVTWMMLYLLRSSAGYSEKLFQTVYPAPAGVGKID